MAYRLLTAASVFLVGRAQEQTTATDMGPTAFMWPPDRIWSADKDNTAPCGSSSGVDSRTQFPLKGGAIALVDQTESWSVQVALSYSQDPKFNDDFLVVIAATRLADFDPGHKCVPFPDPKSGTRAGANATIQLRYLSEFDAAANQTFYACADITYVAAADFTASVPCFNVSVEDPTAVTSAAATGTTGLQTGNGSGSSGGATSHVGAIVGGVIRGVAGLALLVLGVLLFRRRQKTAIKKRQQESVRRVQWGQQFKNRASSSQGSHNSIGLEHLDR